MKNAKFRLLIVLTLSEWGGVQSYVFHTAQEAMRRDFDVLVAANGQDELAEACRSADVPYRELTHMERRLSPIKDVQAIRELYKLMKEWKPDTAFLHSSKAGVVGSIAARFADVNRVVYRIGGWSFLDPVSSIQKSIRIWSEKLTARFKDVIIVLHPGDEALAKRYGITPKEAVRMIPNGIDIRTFEWKLLCRSIARERLMSLWTRGLAAGEHPSITTEGDSPLIVTLANFFPTKGLSGYLDAMKTVHEVRPDARFLVIGEGRERKTLESKRHELGLDTAVSFPGFIGEAHRLLRGADLFVLPSAKEGMPWALLEAMAAKRPCVVTDTGANAWMLGKNGWVVPVSNPQRLGAAILEALKNSSEATKRAERARDDAEKRFTEQAMFDQTFEILQK